MPKKEVGRPCKLNKKMHDQLVHLVGAGNWYSVACSACKIRYETFNLWMNHGEKLAEDYENVEDTIPKDEVKFFNLFNAIKNAEAFVEDKAISGILNNKDWKAQATYLERKYPSRWGRSETRKVELSGGIEVKKPSEMTDEELNEAVLKQRGE